MSTDPTAPRFKTGDQLKAADLNKIVSSIPRVQTGPGVVSSQSDAGTVLTAAAGGPRPKQTFYARITLAIEDTPNRWTYSWEEVIKTGRGYSTWGTRPNGRSGNFADESAAHNFTEEMNSAGGVQGHGINISANDFPDGFATVPCPAGQIVLMFVVPLADGTGFEHWFNFTNDVDGTCNG